MTEQSTILVNVRLTLAYLAEQPIIHTEETIGNISKIKKMRVIYNGKSESVPALSGNSFRGQIRDIFADQLCFSLSDSGANPLTFKNNDAYGILYSGGALGEKNTGAGLLKDFQSHIPSVRLMGAAFGNVMLPSKIAATHIIPCAEQTQEILRTMYTSFDNGLVPTQDSWPKARDLIFNDGPLTRKDDARDLSRQRFAQPSSTPDTAVTQNADAASYEEKQKGQQMIYYVECIPAGTWLLQQIYSKLPLDQLELGCLFDGLSMFLQQPSIGGRSAAGYGQVRVLIQGKVGTETVCWPVKWPKNITQAIEAYKAYLETKKTQILATLTAQKKQAEQ